MLPKICRLLLPLPLFFASCGRAPDPPVDPDLAREIQTIRAIDNHAHPVRYTAPAEPPTAVTTPFPWKTWNRLPIPSIFRPGAPAVLEAHRALYGSGSKQSVMARQQSQYPAWVLDRMGVDIMLANRVDMGPSLQPPRFRWVAYVDALLFPLDNSALAARNPDRAAFFALEDKLAPATIWRRPARKLPPPPFPNIWHAS